MCAESESGTTQQSDSNTGADAHHKQEVLATSHTTGPDDLDELPETRSTDTEMARAQADSFGIHILQRNDSDSYSAWRTS